MHVSRLFASFAAALAICGVATIPASASSPATSTEHCPGITLHFSGQPPYTISNLASTDLVSCTYAQNLARAAYGQGPLHPHSVRSSGRPSESVSGGWTCSTGAGGGSCSNRKQKYDTVGAGRLRVGVEFSTRD